MAEFLALEWDADQISGLVASVSTGSVRVKKCLQFPRPEDWASMTPQAAGAWLKDRLAESGVRAESALVSLPRSDVVMKRLEVPDVADDELPTLVKFQAAAKAAQPIDELYLDYIPTQRREGLPREVVVVTCPKSDGEQIREALSAAGLELASLGVTPVALAEVVARVNTHAPDDQAATVVISRHGPRLEVFVLLRQVLIFSHATRLREDFSTHEQLQATVGEVSRALVSLRGANAGLKIGQAWLLADPTETAGLTTALKPRLGCDVQMLDPFSTVTLEPPATEPVDVSWFAGPIGLLLAKSGAKIASIDFLAPRQPPVKRDPRRAQFAKIGIAAAVLAGLGLLWYVSEYWRLSTLVADREKQKAELTDFVTRGESVLKSAEAVEKWNKGSVMWMDQFTALMEKLPANDRIYLTKLELSRPNSTASDHVGMVSLEGFARERGDVTGLNQRLMAVTLPYHHAPKDIKPSKNEPYYKWDFKSEVLIGPPKPAPKETAPKETATKATQSQTPGTQTPAAKPAPAPAKQAEPPKSVAAVTGSTPAKPGATAPPAKPAPTSTQPTGGK